MSRQTRSKRFGKAATTKDVPDPARDSLPVSPPAMPTLTFASPAAWEAWLDANHQSTSVGIWLKIAKKGCETPSVTYDQAVDGALCFGWIDGQRKACDEQFFVQRFTPRRKGSVWARRNVDKVAALAGAGRMRPAGDAEVDAAKADGRWAAAYAPPSAVQVPPDFLAALAADKRALAFFEGLNKTQRYSFLWRVETAKKAETRERRIKQFVEMLRDHKTLH